jgi:protein-S-isoprenylcysteine O-methyltransferase Ste14
MRDPFFSAFQLAGLAFFLTVVIARAVSVRRQQRTNPIRLSLTRDGVRRLVPAGVFVAVLVWGLEVVFYAIGKPLRVPAGLHVVLVSSLPARLAGAALVVAGFALFVLAMARLGASWRMGIDETNPGELVTDGVYALTRNPIYIFFDLYFVGTFLINGALLFLLFAILVAIGLHLQILEEERFLFATFDGTYRAYTDRVGRYLRWRVLAPTRPRTRHVHIEREAPP